MFWFSRLHEMIKNESLAFLWFFWEDQELNFYTFPSSSSHTINEHIYIYSFSPYTHTHRILLCFDPVLKLTMDYKMNSYRLILLNTTYQITQRNIICWLIKLFQNFIMKYRTSTLAWPSSPSIYSPQPIILLHTQVFVVCFVLFFNFSRQRHTVKFRLILNSLCTLGS